MEIINLKGLPHEIIMQIIVYLNLDEKMNLFEYIVTNIKLFNLYIKNNKSDKDIQKISTCHFFVSNGLFNLLKFAKQNKRIYKWNPAYVCRTAAEMGNLKIIEWCITQKPFHWDYTICASAAFHGHLEIIKWIKANGFPWDSTACASAALNNQFETLEWLKKNGCPWNKYTCLNAVSSGNLPMLIWCRSQNPPCDWDVEICNLAAKKGYLEILQWCLAQNPPCPSNKHMYKNAKQNNHNNIVRWLLQNKKYR